MNDRTPSHLAGLSAADRELVRAHAARLVAEAPPPTEEQRRLVGQILRRAMSERLAALEDEREGISPTDIRPAEDTAQDRRRDITRRLEDHMTSADNHPANDALGTAARIGDRL